MTEPERIPCNPIRTDAEIQAFRRCCALTDEAYARAMARVRVGMTEIDVKAAFEESISALAAEQPAGTLLKLNFLIIESGERTALLHGRATERVLSMGEFLTVDFGLNYNGCCSDFTRTSVLGVPDARQRDVYGTVLRAIRESERSILPGMTGHEADAIARKVIDQAGCGPNFCHALGHGFGDFSGRQSVYDGIALAEDVHGFVLAPGMVFTIEPGIYIDGYGGVRIEDTVLLTEQGVEPLFTYTKELQSILETEETK